VPVDSKYQAGSSSEAKLIADAYNTWASEVVLLYWCLPGWMEQHSNETYEKLGNLIREHIPQIQSAFLRFMAPGSEEFSVPLGEGCLILMTRIKSFSPTFPEYFQLVEPSRRLDVKVLVNECPLHSITELAGRLYESTRGSRLEVLNNTEIKDQIVLPMLSTVKTQRAPAKMRNAAVISIFYSTGLRLNEIADLKIENIDFETGAVGFPDRKEK
jgi:hypothetical protein